MSRNRASAKAAGALSRGQVRLLNKFWAKFGMRFCNKCGTTKDFSEFGKFDGGRGRFKAICRRCDCARSRSPEVARKASAKYRAANPEKVRAIQAKHRNGGRDPEKPWPEGWCSYKTAHQRPRSVYGPAKDHPCSVVGCPNRASEWAYTGTDPNEFSVEQVDARNGSVRVMRYSGLPWFYQAMCHGCHVSFDVLQAKERSV